MNRTSDLLHKRVIAVDKRVNQLVTSFLDLRLVPGREREKSENRNTHENMTETAQSEPTRRQTNRIKRARKQTERRKRERD